MGERQLSSHFRAYTTLLAILAVAVSTFLIYTFSQEIIILPGLHFLYTELFIASLLVPLAVTLFILASRRQQLLQCNNGRFPLVEVAGVLVILLAMAALIAGSVLAWWAATAIGENFQVRGNCFCSVGSTSTQLQSSTEDQSSLTNPMIPPVDRLGLCRDQGVGCYVVSTAVQVNITKMLLYTKPCQRVDLSTHLDPVCLQYTAFHRLYPALLILLPFIAFILLPSLIYTCGWIQNSKSEGSKDKSMSDSTSWRGLSIPRKSTGPYFAESVQHLPAGIRPSPLLPHETPLSQLPHRSANLCGGSSSMRNLASPLMGTLKPVSCPVAPPQEFLTQASETDSAFYDSSTPPSPSGLDSLPCAMSTPMVGQPYCGQVVSVTLNSTGSGTIKLREREVKATGTTNLASTFFPPDLLPKGKESE